MIVFLQACKGTQPKQTFEQGFFAGNHCLVYCLCNCTLYYVLHSWECRQWFPWENKDMCQIRKTQYWHRVNHETKIPWECRKPNTVGIQSLKIGKKVLGSFDNIFHVYLMNGLQKYKKKKISRWLFEIIHIIRFEI